MKKTGVLIMTALSVAVLIFSATVFADQSGLLDAADKGTVSKNSSLQKKMMRGASADTAVPSLIRGTGVFRENGIYRYFENGVFKRKTGVFLCPEDGQFRLVRDGIFSSETGIAMRPSDGKWVYVKNGEFKKATGAAKRFTDGEYLYVKNGVFSKTTNLVRKLDSKKYLYVKKGVLDKKTGLVQKKNKQWVFVRDGVLATNPRKFLLTETDESAGRQELLCEVFARTIYDKVVEPGMNKEEKLRACFDYLTPEDHFYYLMKRIPYYTAPDSTVVYTLDMIRDGGSTCHGFASLFAYLGRLCGYENSYYCWSSYHGWAEIDGKIYDPVFLGEPHNTEVYATPYDVGREMGLGTDYVEMNRYRIPEFKDK